MRFLPRSLLGQVMLVVAAALLIAQAISAALLFRAAEQRREMALMHTAAFQLISGPSRGHLSPEAAAMRERLREERGARGMRPRARLPRRLRFSESAVSPVSAGERRDARREAALSAMLGEQGIEIDAIAVTIRPFRSDPDVRAAMQRFPHLNHRLQGAPHDLMVVGLKRAGADSWQVVRLPVPPRDRRMLPTIVLQTLILFVVLFALLYFVLRRITRPLHTLADRTRRFAGAGAPEPPLPPSGPHDVRDLIQAHNAMEARIGSMLDEKDVMLGAIGHDLKTPLSALRVRIEAVEDETQRARMADTIEDIARTLDEILSLARVGRSDAAPENAVIGALAAAVVEEFEDMGEPVSLDVEGRIAAPVHITWLKRGLRNLIANALRYAGSAKVSVLREGNTVVLRVEDEGPGIPEDRLAAMLEPFARGETSRNRETGGAGLGLALARAVAEQHGGEIILANRPEGGLRADIRLPQA